jgi:hypothetical protein
MITEVDPKSSELTLRIVGQIGAGLGLCYMIYMLFRPIGQYHFHNENVNRWLIFLGLVCLNIVLFLQIYFLPFGLVIDDELKTLELKYLMVKPKVIKVFDITGYSTTTIKSRTTEYLGIFIYLSNSKKVLISDLTFENYTPVQVFLDDLKVNSLGEEKFSWLSYYSHP